MTDREAYEATLDRLRRDLVKAEAAVARAQEEVARAEAYTERLRGGIAAITSIVDEDAPAVRVEGVRPDAVQGSVRFKLTAGASLEQAAVAAAKAAGRPVRLREIYDILVQNDWMPYKKYSAFQGSMFPTISRSERFRRVGKGLYALADGPNGSKAQGAEHTLDLG